MVALIVISACAAMASAGCAERAPEEAGPSSTRTEVAPALVRRHLLHRGARRALRAHPAGHWHRGALVLPAGGPTCAVASITAGAHGPLVTDAVFDDSGTVTVRIRAAEGDRERCRAAARRALEGFAAPTG